MSELNLLTIDWDFFFPRPPVDSIEAFEFYDWSHMESKLHIEMLWSSRASGFLLNDKPLPAVNDQWRGFWDQFQFSPGAKLFFGESHSSAANRQVERGINGQVWLFDAHHDAGYVDKPGAMKGDWLGGRWDCSDWMVLYGWKLGPDRLHVRYPTHRSEAFKEEQINYFGDQLERKFYQGGEPMPRFHRVMVCRSGAWVPPWDDQKYEQFLASCPAKDKIDLGSVQREWNMDQVNAQTEQIRRMYAEGRESAGTDVRYRKGRLMSEEHRSDSADPDPHAPPARLLSRLAVAGVGLNSDVDPPYLPAAVPCGICGEDRTPGRRCDFDHAGRRP